MHFSLTCSAFANGADIPRSYTCQGKDISPPLTIAHVPSGAQSLVLIVDDPDVPDPRAPRRTWVHWILFNLPPTTTSLPEAMSSLPPGAQSGTNDWQRTGYGGPCPPMGKHRYFFRLYALDTQLALKAPTKAQVVEAMQGHILAQTELLGFYQKS